MVRVCGQIVQYEVKGQCNVWRRLNKSYYEPFQGFSYCILVSNIVDMQNKIKLNLKNNNKRSGTRKGNTCTDRYIYLSKLQHFVSSTVAFELTNTPLGTAVMV